MKKTFASLLLFLSFLNGFSQQKHWIFFRDKDLSAKTEISEKAKINRRMLGLSESQFTDIPVSKNYIFQLQNLDIRRFILAFSEISDFAEKSLSLKKIQYFCWEKTF